MTPEQALDLLDRVLANVTQPPLTRGDQMQVVGAVNVIRAALLELESLKTSVRNDQPIDSDIRGGVNESVQ